MFTANNSTALWNANMIQGKNVVNTTPTTSQVLQFDGANWKPATISSGTTYTAGSGLSLIGTTINSVFTTTGSNIKNNNTGHVHFFDGMTTSSNKVIIGGSINNMITTTSGIPGAYRLYVQGGILTERIKVATLGGVNWADYVFDTNYKLMPLSEVENFISYNNHLPNIPPACDLALDGFDLIEMAAKQMEKIEELTLYIIELDKKYKELESTFNSQIKNR